MRLKFAARYIDGKLVLYSLSGEQIPFAEVFDAFHVKEGECVPVSISISDEEDDDDDEEKRKAEFFNFIQTLKEKWPDGYCVTKDGKRVKIRGIASEP